MKQKIKNQKGFTLIELLACTITLVLVGTICTTGMQVALKAYSQSVYESDSQMLESTLNLYMSDILRYAFEIQTTGEADDAGLQEIVGFSNTAYQMTTGKIALGTTEESNGKIVVFDRETSDVNCKEIMLVGKNVYADTLYITDLNIKYNQNSKCFVGTYKIKSRVIDGVERTCSFTCRSVLTENVTTHVDDGE